MAAQRTPAAGARPAPPESLSDYALRSIRADLVEGRLLPGQRVAAEQLAASLAISHVPVREALRHLEAEGHLERDPRSLTRVRDVTPAEADEIYQLRELLETEIHKTAVPAMRGEDFAELDLHFDDMEEAIREGDIAQFARANRAFHFVVFNRSGRAWMVRFLNIIWDAAARYQTSLFLTPGWEISLQQHHEELRIALRAHDVHAVNRIMNDHRHVTVEATHAAGSSDGQHRGEAGEFGP